MPAGPDGNAPGNAPDETVQPSYADWAQVAAAIEDGELEGEGFKPAGSGTESDPYAITTPEALAWWAAYHAGDAGTFARLDSDIDLTTVKYASVSAQYGSGDDPSVILSGATERSAVEGSRETAAETLWTSVPTLAAELDGDGHAIYFRTKGAGLADTVAETGAVRWLSLGRTQAELAAADPALAATSVATEGPRAGSVAGTNKGTIEGVVNRMPVSWEPGDAPAASSLVGGVAGVNDGRILDCANLGAVANASAASESAAAGIAAAGIGTVETCYSAGPIDAAANGAYLATTLTADAPYEDLVRASFYLAPGNEASYDGVAVADRDGALSPDELRDAAGLLNDGRGPAAPAEGDAAAPWRSAADAGDASPDGATQGYPAPARPADAGAAEDPSAAAPEPPANALAADESAPAATGRVYSSWYEVAYAVDRNEDGMGQYQETSSDIGIKTPEGLAWNMYMACEQEPSSGSLKLGADIDLSGTKYTADGSPLPWCSWTLQRNFALDGQGYAITGMYVVGGDESGDRRLTPVASSNVARWGRGFVSGMLNDGTSATFKNLTIQGKVDVTAGAFTGGFQNMVPYCAGGLVGFLGEGSSHSVLAENVVVDVDVHGAGATGGFVGYVGKYNSFSTSRCTNKGPVYAEGSDSAANKDYLYTDDEDMPKQRQAIAGGLAGVVVSNGSTSSLDGFRNEGSVTSANRIAAGVVGYACYMSTNITRCCNVGAVESQGGYPSNAVDTDIPASVGGVAAGLVGIAVADPYVMDCYNRGPVKSGYTAGGLFGVVRSGVPEVFTSSYNAAPVTSTYADAKLPDGSYTPEGGLGGAVAGDFRGNITNKNLFFYDQDLCKTALQRESGTVQTHPLTTAQMKSAEAVNYLNAASSESSSKGVWSRSDAVNDGYPFLTLHASAGQTYKDWSYVAEAVGPNGDLYALRPAGSGTKDDPYLVRTPEALAYLLCFGSPVMGVDKYTYVELMADIDLGGAAYGGMAWDGSSAATPLPWLPLEKDKGFRGSLEGNGHTISNLYVGEISDAVTGGLVQQVYNFAEADGPTKIGGFTIEGSIKLSSYTKCGGGVAGYATTQTPDSPAEIHDIISRMSVNSAGSDTTRAGGILGLTDGGCNISRCGFEGKINVPSGSWTVSAGGLVGESGNTSYPADVFEDCYSTGSIEAAGSVKDGGGLVGTLTKATFRNCYSAATLTTPYSIQNAGMVVGSQNSSTRSYSVFYDSDMSQSTNVPAVGSGSESALDLVGMPGELMKLVEFPVTLNYGRTPPVWGTPEEGENQGYPVLGRTPKLESWQQVGTFVESGLLTNEDGSSLVPKKNADGAYVIETPEAFAWLIDAVNGGNKSFASANAVVAVDSLDMTGAAYGGTPENPLPWVPIGNASSNAAYTYKGTFDGAGVLIDHVRVNTPKSLDDAKAIGASMGLFGVVEGGTVKNVRVGAASTYTGVTVGQDAGAGGFGGIAGMLKDGARVEDCSFAGRLEVVRAQSTNYPSTYQPVGGIAGMLSGAAAVERCSFEKAGSVSVPEDAAGKAVDSSGYALAMGGIVGYFGEVSSDQLVADCYSAGEVGPLAGGGTTVTRLNGIGFSTGTVRNCYVAGAIIASNTSNLSADAIGLGTVENCFYLDSVGVSSSMGNTTKATAAQMRDAAFVKQLNNGRIGESAPWVADDAASPVNSGYPVFGLNYGSWADIGAAVVEGAITGANFMPTGSGTSADPYKISTPEAFGVFAWAANNGKIIGSGTVKAAEAYAELSAPVDLTGADYGGTAAAPFPWMPVGTGSTASFTAPFKGSFDGKSQEIANLAVNASNVGAGLFGAADGATIRNVKIGAGSSITGGWVDSAAGGVLGIAGTPSSTAAVTIENCTSASTINMEGTQAENGPGGGIVGIYASPVSAPIKGCTVLPGATVITPGAAGGIVGSSTASIEDCSHQSAAENTLSVMVGGTMPAGGIVGEMSGASVSRCSSVGGLSSQGCAAGIVGSSSAPSLLIEDCYNRGATGCYFGGSENTIAAGIAGPSASASSTVTLKNCYNAGEAGNSHEKWKPYGIAAPYTQGGTALPATVSASNCYYNSNKDNAANYLDKDKALSGVTAKTAADMKAAAFVKILNRVRPAGEAPWVADSASAPANDGFPVLGVGAGVASWADVGEAVAAGVLTGEGFIPTQAGTASDPYQISTPEALAWFAYMVNTNRDYGAKSAKLMKDISLDGTAYTGAEKTLANALLWTPIGKDATNWFGGAAATSGVGDYASAVFDGNGKTVDYMRVDGGGYAGLLGCAHNCTIKGITTGANSSVTSTGNIVGGIVGGYEAWKKNGTVGYAMVVEDCINRATVTGDSKVGGVAGDIPYNGGSVPGMRRCANYGDIAATTTGDRPITGGVVAQPGENDLVDCYNRGAISFKNSAGATHVGGIAAQGPGKVTNCYNAGKQTGGQSLCGWYGFSATTVSNSYYDSTLVTGTTNQGKALTPVQFQSWAAAYGLNGNKFGNTGMTWTLDTANANGGYPVFGDSLRAAADWGEVGLGVDAGLIAGKPTQNGTDEANAFELGSEEALAWFAYKSNTDAANFYNKFAKITKDGLDLTGTTYGGTAAAKLQWTPISEYNVDGKYGHGKSSGNYEGTFDGGGFVISNLYQQKTGVPQDEGFGLFGFVSKGTVRNVVLKDVDINAASTKWITVGGIASQITGGATVSGCGVESGTIVGTVVSANMVGGIVGDSHDGGGTIENCYARASVKGGAAGGGILGRAMSSNQTTMKNCYFAGTTQGNPLCNSGLGGVIRSNNYYDSTLFPGEVKPSGGFAALTTDQLKSWAAAYALNGSKQGTPWTYDADVNDGYPSFGTLGAPSDWGEVGLGVDAGLITGADFKPSQTGDDEAHAYEISTPEALAWFAYKVSTDNATYAVKCAKLTQTISLAGTTYGGTESSDFTGCLKWVPIAAFSGDFDGGGFAVENLFVNQSTGGAGFFSGLAGLDSNPVSVHDFGVASGSVTGLHSVGGIAGVLSRKQNKGAVTVERCWNAASVTGTGKNNGNETMAGGIAGYALGAIANCYNTGSITAAASEAGGIAGSTTSISGYTSVENCYNTGTVTGSSRVGAINGYHVNEKSPTTNCYYLKGSASAGFGMNTGTGQATELTDDQLKSWAAAFALNGKKQGTPWTYDSNKNDGYPSFGTLGAASDWAAIGFAVDAGLIAGTNFKPAQTGDDEAHAYEISTPEALAWFAYKVNTDSSNFKATNAKLTQPIDLSGKEYGGSVGTAGDASDYDACLLWKPISSFSGSLDGGGKKITNLRADANTGEQGFISNFSGGTVKNLAVASGIVRSSNYAGAIVSTAGSGTISGCSTGVDLTVSSVNIAGGIAGCYTSGTAEVVECVNAASVISNGEAGGIVGAIYGCTLSINNCANLGKVETKSQNSSTTKNRAAGIFGRTDFSLNGKVSITGCYSSGTVTAAENGKAYGVSLVRSGGITITDSAYNTEATTSSDSAKDGLALTGAQLKTWGAAYYLNGGTGAQKVGDLTTWRKASNASENSGYPVLCSAGQTMDAAADWSEVGEWVEVFSPALKPVEDGTSAACSVASPEALAWVAYKANNGMPAIKATLTGSDIDLTGANYRAAGATNLSWVPIGASVAYTGTFDGNKHVVKNLSVSSSANAGLIGILGTGAKVSALGVEVAGVRGTATAGSLAGSMTGGTVEDCYAVSSNGGTVQVSSGKAAGLIGSLDGGMVSRSFAAVPIGNGGTVSAFANKSGATALVTACLYDRSLLGASSDSSGATGYESVMMKSILASNALNNGSQSGVWTWAADVNGGYPSFGAAVALTLWQQVGAAQDETYLRDTAKAADGTPALAGTGADANNALTIATPEALAWFANLVNTDGSIANAGGTPQPAKTAFVKLACAIDLAGAVYGGTAGGDFSGCLLWTPIATFSGDFDGDSNQITNLLVNSTNDNQGFFGALDAATVKNLTLASGSVQGKSYVGGFTGLAKNKAVIQNCATGAALSVTGADIVGGFMGESSTGGSTVERCVNSATVKSKGEAGGIVGSAYLNPLSIKNCANLADITSSGESTEQRYRCAGGIFGRGTYGLYGATVTITGCYSAGKVTATDGVAYGVANKNTNGGSASIQNCAYDKDVATAATASVEGVAALTTPQLKSWAAAYYLNGNAIGAGTTWTTDGASYPSFGELRAAADWGEVGLGVDAGLIAGTNFKPAQTGDDEAHAYEISTPEALAWFAYKVNTDNSTFKIKKAKLTQTINLSGKDYGGTETSDFTKCLQWVPISPYSGDFDGGGFAVENLYINKGADHVGFFGSLQGIASDAESDVVSVHDFGVASGSVTGTHTLGGIAGSTGRVRNRADVTVERCWNNASVKGTGKSGSETMAGGIAGYVNGSIVDCYNAGSVSAAAASAGGIAGSTTSYSGYTRVANCYNAGTVSGPSQFGAINGWHQNSSSPTTNCYYLDSSAPAGFGRDATNGEAKALTADQLKSWAAAYALNGGNGTQALGDLTTWRKASGSDENAGYPVLCTNAEAMTPAADWGEVGAWVDVFAPSLQPKAGTDGAYEITTPEALAWFAYKVNDVATTREFGAKSVSIMNDINLDGSIYTGKDKSAVNALQWVPLGKGYDEEIPDSNIWYGGAPRSGCGGVVFDGGGNTVDYMRVEADDFAGFIGAIHNATLKGIVVGGNSSVTSSGGSSCYGGIAGGYDYNAADYDGDGASFKAGGYAVRVEGCVNRASIDVIGSSAGGVIGALPPLGDAGGYAMSRCANYGKIDASNDDTGGGLVGQACGNTVAYCYNRGEVDASLPGIANNALVALGCYNVAVTPGSYYPIVFNSVWSDDDSYAPDCYYVDYDGSDRTNGDQGTPLTDAQMKSWNTAYGLNGSKHVGSDDGTNPTTTVWTTDEQKNGPGSLKNDGYPVFGNLDIEKLTVTLDPAGISTATGASKKTAGKFMDSESNEKTLSGRVYLEKDPVVPAGITLMDEADVQYGFSTWGTTTANSKFALFANVIIKPSLSLPLQIGRDLTGINLCAAAAYNAKDACDITFEVSDDFAHYRVTATVKAFEGSKTLDVTLPVESASSFELSPDGEVHEGESAAKAAEPSVMKSNNALPLAGRVAKVEPLAAGTKRDLDGKEVNAVLNPAAASTSLAPTSDPVADDDPATPDNAKLFAAASGADASLTALDAPLYYDPKSSTVPLYFAVPGGTEARWKWGMDYTGTYLGQEGVFGYAVSYEVGLSASDLAAPSINGTGYQVAPGVYATEPYAGEKGRYGVKWNRSAS